MTTKTLEASLGVKIRELRRERRWTQSRLSKLLGITQGHLSQLERGNRELSAKQLLTILKHFNVQLDYFSTGRASADNLIQNALARQGVDKEQSHD